MAIIVGTKYDEVINGTNSADTIFARYGVDTVKGRDGDDIIYGDANRVTGGVETLYGGLGNDKIYGNDGDDVLYGNEGNDLLKGDNGNDKLYGNSGDDLLEGGSGIDQLKGGTGNDVYAFMRGSQQDVVIEEGGSFDAVRLQTGVNKNQIGFFRVGNDLQIGYAGSSDVFTVQGQFGPASHQVEFVANQRGLDYLKASGYVEPPAGNSPALGIVFTAAEIDTITAHLATVPAVTSLNDVLNDTDLLKYIAAFA